MVLKFSVCACDINQQPAEGYNYLKILKRTCKIRRFFEFEIRQNQSWQQCSLRKHIWGDSLRFPCCNIITKNMFPQRMNSSYLCTFVLPIFMCFCVTVFSTDTGKCYLNSKTNDVEEEKLLNRISPLFGQVTEKDGFKYVVAICSDTSKLLANVSVTKSKVKDDTIILGRRNETHLIGGDTWVLLKYECGDKYPNETDKKCLGHHSASIYIVCDPQSHDDLNIKLVEEDGCHYKFVLPCMNICQHEEEVSGSTVFFIIFSVAFFMYFIVGIIYRRLVYNAQGCQQLPHFTFWQRIGVLLSDGCNFICRCDLEPEDSWNNITSNFDSGDRDDALLRP